MQERKYELHVHTAECDKFATLGGSEIVRRYYDAGYHGMVITDHYFAPFYQWFQNELNTKYYSQNHYRSLFKRILRRQKRRREDWFHGIARR